MFIRTDSHDSHSLISAYNNQDIVLFKKLIADGCNINCLTKTGDSLINLVIMNSNVIDSSLNKEFFDELLRNDVHLGRTCGNYSVLNLAIREQDDIYYMSELLKKNVPVDLVYERIVPLDPVNIAKKSKNNITSRRIYDVHPIIHTIATSNNEKIKLLLDYNPDLTVTSKTGATVMDSYISFVMDDENLELLKMLIKKGANLHQKGSKEHTLLHQIAQFSYSESLYDFFIENNFDINSRSKSGYTPLMTAASRDNTLGMKILIDRGADINMQNVHGRTASMLALNKVFYRINVLDFLIRSNADLSIVDNNGNNTIHYMVEKLNNKELNARIDCFINNKKLLLIKNSRGETPLDLLKQKENSKRIHAKLFKLSLKCEKNFVL